MLGRTLAGVSTGIFVPDWNVTHRLYLQWMGNL
jgi:hypothetical protein